MTPFTQAYGSRLREARLAADISQTELARRLGLSRSSVANIEAGRQGASAEQVVDAAAALSCDPRWLLTGWDSDRHAPQPKGVHRRDIRRHTAPIRALLNELEGL